MPGKEHVERKSAAALLVRWRGILAVLVATVTVVSAVLIPRIRINADLTSNLPDSSPMRQGLNILEQDFPNLDIRMQTLRVMFYAEAPSDSLQQSLESLLESGSLSEVREHDGHTLYQFFLPKDADGAAAKQLVADRFGDRVRVELEDNKGMPEHVPLMVGTGFVLILIILFVMCPSFVEVLLFLLAFGMAIVINTGTNALLPSVTLITSSIAAIMQLALSLDYAIILMNRYRQEKPLAADNRQAMTAALSKAAPAILSSNFTTVSSLMMLCFMRLKMGADLGIVLSKGVLCSLLVTFTLLPALILLCDKAITATQKRVPVIPTEGLARFEWRFRWPLAILFAGLLVGGWFLQRQTDMYYSVTRATPITREFPTRNRMLVIYPTAEEEAVIPLVDSLSGAPGLSCISYPSIMLKLRTASDLATLSPELAEKVPPEALDLLYYAATHPERNERMRIDELEPTARSLVRLVKQLAPDVEVALPKLPSLSPAPAPQPKPEPVPEPVIAVVDTPAVPVAVAVPEDTAAIVPAVADSTPVVPPAPANELDRRGLDYSYEQITRPRTLAEMTAYLPVEAQYIRLVYRMAGRKDRSDRMTAYEFMSTVSEKVLQNRRYTALIPEETRLLLAEVQEIFDAVVEAGPTPVVVPDSLTVGTDLLADAALEGPDTAGVVAPPMEEPAEEPVEAVAEDVPDEDMPNEDMPEMTPLEELIELALSGKRCTAAQCYEALSRAGVPVKRQEISLLYLYHGYQTARDTTCRLSLLELSGYLERLIDNDFIRHYLDTARLVQLEGLRRTIDEELGALRSDTWSVAVISADLPEETDETYAFIDRIRSFCDGAFTGPTYLTGYSVMYQEMKAGFPRELLVLTLLTVLAIFLIVAFTFRSLIIPFLLVSSVMTAVWLDVAVSGLSGPMFYLSYLVLQSVLMGATIDYSILYTNYYREFRRTLDRQAALTASYRGSLHTILTSGMIMVLGTGIMSLVISDPIIVPVIRSVSQGALIAILLILFLLPAVLALLDRWIKKK